MTLAQKEYLAQRLLVTSIVVFIFIVYSFLFIDANQQSCLGNPTVLPFIFLGIPFLIALAILDLLIAGIKRNISWFKVAVNISISVATLFAVYLL